MKYLCTMLPVIVKVGWLNGRFFGLQYRGGSFPAHRFLREKRNADGWDRVDLTAGGYMVR